LIAKVTGSTIQTQATNLYQKAVADYGISTIILALTFFCLFTPSVLFFKQLSAYTLYVMLGMLFAGIVFFVLKLERLMMVSFICCCILCLHLKSSSNKQMRLAAVTTNPSLTISHVNLANAENEYDSVINYLMNQDADIISFQELTPDWNAVLTERLSTKFKYIHTMTRLDQYGMGFFSKIPIQTIDTIYFQEVPTLISSVKIDSTHLCHIFNCQVVPPVNQAAFTVIENHFEFLKGELDKRKGNKIVLGDLHLPPWSSEIQQFKINCHLQDSRRDINPRNIDGSVSLPRIPVEHIFYCEKFECTSFSELGNDVVGRVGITGTYQLHNGNAEVVQ
jgi:endonuclease/exonuclease/phosphatase (EEP) superfamily protein YafD